MALDFRDRLKKVAEGQQVPAGAGSAIAARLKERGYESKPIPLQVARESMGPVERVAANAYNAAQSLVSNAASVIASPLEAAGQVGEMMGMDDNMLRRGAASVRDSVAYDPRMMVGGQPLVRPGLGSEVAGGLGSAAGFMAGGVATRGLGMGAKFGAGLLGSTTQSSMMYLDAEASGADEKTKNLAFLAGVPIGMTEMATIGGTGKLGELAERLVRLDKRSNGAFGAAVKNVVTQGLEEGAQEGIQSASEKLVAQEFLKYADEQDLAEFMSDVGRSTALGAAVGGLLGGPGTALAEKIDTRFFGDNPPKSQKVTPGQSEQAAKLDQESMEALGGVAQGAEQLDPTLDARGKKRTQATAQEAVEGYAKATGMEQTPVFEELPPEQDFTDEEFKAKYPDHQELLSILAAIQGSGRTVPPIVLVEGGDKGRPAAYQGGVVLIDKAKTGEAAAGLALHELVHGRARAGTQAFTDLVSLAQTEFPTVARVAAQMYSKDFEATTGQKPFATIPDGPARDAMLQEEGFAVLAESMPMLINELMDSAQNYTPEQVREVGGFIERLWEMLRNALNKVGIGKGVTSQKIRAQKIEEVTKMVNGRLLVREDVSLGDLVKVGKAIADLMTGVDTEVLAEALKSPVDPKWWAENAFPALPAGPKIERLPQTASIKERPIELGSESRSTRLGRTKAAQAVNAQGEPIQLPVESTDTKRKRYQAEVENIAAEVGQEPLPMTRAERARAAREARAEARKRAKSTLRPVTEAEAKIGPPTKREARRQRYEERLARQREERGQALRPDRARRDDNPTAAQAAIDDFEEGIDRFATAGDYQGEHQPPDSESGSPLHNVVGVYPEDIYGPNGLRYYGVSAGGDFDVRAYAIIQRFHNRPDAKVTVYRAVSDKLSASKRLEIVEKHMASIMRRGKIPSGVEWGGSSSQLFNALYEEREFLRTQEPTAEPDINPGDWVSIVRNYVKEHGEATLGGRYVILKKRVAAKDLFTAGDSWLEWGYAPQGNRGTFDPTNSDIRFAVSPTIEVDGQERPRLNSDGRPIATTDEALRNFWRGFSESKVVDDEGRPLVTYHGAPDVRGIFAEGFKGMSRGSVFFSSDSQSVANSYADDRRALDYQNAEPGIIPLYLSLQNPLIIDAKGKHWRGTEVLIKDAKASGYDGIIIRNSVDFYNNAPGEKRTSNVYVWFESTQAKSALNAPMASRIDRKPIEGTGPNRGTFDPTNSDIRFAVSPDPDKGDILVANLGEGLVSKGARAWQKNMTSRGLLPQSAFDAMIEVRDSRIAVANKRIKDAASDVRRAVKRAQKDGTAKTTIWSDINRALGGELPMTALPKGVHEQTERLRADVDEFSAAMISSGAVDGKLVAKVASNMGLYLTRSYQAFDDQKWEKKIPVEVRNRAVSLLRERFAKQEAETKRLLRTRADLLEARAHEAEVNARTARMPEKHLAKAEDYRGKAQRLRERADAFKVDKDPDLEIRALLADARNSGSPYAMLAGGKLGSKDLSILKRRKVIAPEIRALLGEYTDPLVNYARSVSKMAFLVANHEFLKTVRAAGLEEGYFSKKKQGDNIVQIAAEESHTMAPLNGLWTSEEVLEAFEDALKNEPSPGWLRAYMSLNGTVKMTKTVGSVQTHARNVVGNGGFMLAQGYMISPEVARNSFAGTLAGLGALKGEQWRAFYADALTYSVVHESARAGELQDIIQDAHGKSLDEILPAMGFKGRLVKIAKGTAAVYQAEDDFFKLIAWQIEQSRYRQAYPEWTDEQVKSHAARIVRNTSPTYSLVPEGIKKLRRLPFMGTFTSFPAEVVRVGWNTAHLIQSELADPRTRKIGAQRLVGSILAASLPTAAALATAFYYGYDDEDREAMREFAAPWDKNADWIYLGKDGKGNDRYINLSYTDPWSYLKSPLHALLNGEDIGDSVLGAVKEAAEPFFSEEILFGTLMNIRSNQTDTGGKVYNDAANGWEQGADVALYLWDKALRPGTLASLERIKKGATGEVTPWGKAYDTTDEIVAMIGGQRRQSLDLEQALNFKARDYSTGITDANKLLSSVAARSGVVDRDEIRAAWESMESARRKTFDDLLKSVRAARRLGLTDMVLEDRLRGAGISQDQTRALIRGVYEPYDITGTFLNFYERGATAERKKELRERRNIVKEIAKENK